ncbi:MAG: DUF975 family protein [Lentisphaeria bacterium]|nr:DUF975 family protein [Lentisphaeria bacterium]
MGTDNSYCAPEKITFSSLWQETWEKMRNNWGKLILVSLLQSLITVGAGRFPVLCIFPGLLLFPMTAGLMLCSLRTARQETWSVEQLFEPFNDYFRMLWGSIRIFLMVFLFTLLLIIPGIIAQFAYSMTIYVMLDEKDLSVKECMKKSTFLMKGYKFKLFLYSFLFSSIGLIVTLCTLGIGLIFFVPFTGVFMANFYNAVKAEKERTSPQTENPGTSGTAQIPAE